MDHMRISGTEPDHDVREHKRKPLSNAYLSGNMA